MENIRISDALQVLTPGAEWSIGNNSYSQLDWLDTEQTKPTEEEVVQKVAELTYQKEVESYKEQRAAEYPSYPDQFDKIYHSGVTAWKTQIKKIKDKYPKQTMDATELQTRQDKAIFDLQTKKYYFNNFINRLFFTAFTLIKALGSAVFGNTSNPKY